MTYQALLAFDVGGTDIKVGLFALADLASGMSVQQAGALELQLPKTPVPREIRRVKTQVSTAGSGQLVSDQIVELTREYQRNNPDAVIRAIGVVVPGIVDELRGVGVYASNLFWQDYPFARVLEERLGLPATLSHDVGSAADAEWAFGAAHGEPDVAVVPIGTGIAAGIYVDGHRIRANGYTGEIGHSPVPGGEVCTCGSTGCLETLASAAAIVRRYNRATGHHVSGAHEVLERAEAGEAIAERIWAEATDALAFAFSYLVSNLGTRVFVLGGGLAGAGEALGGPIVARLERILSFQPRPALRIAQLGADAGLIGSALHAAQRVRELAVSEELEGLSRE